MKFLAAVSLISAAGCADALKPEGNQSVCVSNRGRPYDAWLLLGNVS